MNQTHGVSYVKSEDGSKAVRVIDMAGHIRLSIGAFTPADLTVEEARFVAKCLTDAARRVGASRRPLEKLEGKLREIVSDAK